MLTQSKSMKKVVVLDAGGVLHPDSEFGAPNQAMLSALTKLSQAELNQYQNHLSLNSGESTLQSAFESLAIIVDLWFRRVRYV